MGLHLTIACPRGYEPNREVFVEAEAEAEKSGAKLEVVHDPEFAAKDADVIYTDVWTSMGQEEERAQRLKAFHSFQVNQALVALAKADVFVMHCLPAHRGEEITDEVIDGPRSIVFDQAENRLHVQKAILIELLAR